MAGRPVLTRVGHLNLLVESTRTLLARRLDPTTMIYTNAWYRMRGRALLLAGVASLLGLSAASAIEPDPLTILTDAEQRFTPPDESWFYETQAALSAEVYRVADALDSQGEQYAQPWKQHLRWHLLEKNLVPLAQINLAEIELARRWMYSNRKGIELPFFEKLRTLTDAYLDAAYTLSQDDLYAQFQANVELARAQVAALVDAPTDAHAAALGRTLGWFERTRQLVQETAELRKLLSHPNAQVLVGKDLISDIMASQSPEIDRTLRVADRSEAPSSRRFQLPRTVHVRGQAHTVGTVSLELRPNPLEAELSIVYNGHVDSHCHAEAGPVSFDLRTVGPMSASKPVTWGPSGIEVGMTDVEPHVCTRVTNINANSNLVRRLGERRIRDPQNQAHMSSRARAKAVELLEQEMDENVTTAIEEIRAELASMQANAGEFAEVFAPVVREGAAPYFHGTASTMEFVAANIMSQRREQLGAATTCPLDFPEGDVRVRIHTSFLNNLMETIMAGKKFTDEYFMKYAKVLQPTLPLELMVHARAPRWAVVAATPRPLELKIPSANTFEFTFRLAGFEIDGEQFATPTTATVRYLLEKTDLDEYYLKRTGPVELVSTMPQEHQEFLHKKLSAFFAPVLDGGGVIVPEGGGIGALNALVFLGVQAEHDWLVLGIDVPPQVIDDLTAQRTATADGSSPPVIDEYVLPPVFALDEDLDSYPSSL